MKQETSIVCKTSGDILYQGPFHSLKDCLEQAVQENVDLKGADFRHCNLSGATLDDARLGNADFSGANLSGANLSESVLDSCLFVNANLVDTCLSYSRLNGSDFQGARFGATDIAGAQLSLCTFSGLSTFSLDFMSADSMQGCIYIHHSGQEIIMQHPPKVLKGLLHTPVIMFDGQVLIGSHCLSFPSIQLMPLLSLLLQGANPTKILT